MPGWQQIYHQLESGAFEGEVLRFSLPEVDLYRESLCLRTANHFREPEGTVSIYFRREQPRGPVVQAGFSCATEPRPFIYHVGETVAMAVFPQDVFAAEEAMTEGYGIWEGVAPSAISSVADWIDRLLHPDTGAFYRDAPGFTRLAPKLLHDQVSLWFDRPGWSRGRLPEARRVVGDLLAWLHGAPVETLSARDAAAGTGHALRLLRDSCRVELDLPLEQLLLTYRLNLVRRALIRAAGTGATVSDIALDHGFSHWGRFSARYRAFFGELPSETLRGRR